MRKTTILVPLLAFLLGGIARGDERADAVAILDTGIKAQGGEALLSKFVGITVKSKGTSYDGEKKTPVSYEGTYQGFDKSRVFTFTGQNKLLEIEVVSGKEGWAKEGDETTEKLTGDQLESSRASTYVSWATMLTPLKSQEFRLSLIDNISVAGRKAVGILVARDKHQPLKMYFDSETHLLVQYQYKFKDPDLGKESEETCVISDYRTVQDMKQPFTFETYLNGVKDSDLTVTEMKFYEKPFDEKLFTKP